MKLTHPIVFKLYKARYPYGAIYIQNGQLHLPDGNEGLIRLDNPNVPKQIQEDLHYKLGTYPVAFILDKNGGIIFTIPTPRITSTLYLCYARYHHEYFIGIRP